MHSYQKKGGRYSFLAPDSELSHAREEADRVASCFSAADVFLAEDAGAESSLREMSDSAVLHFVGHGRAPDFQKSRYRSFPAGGLMIGPSRRSLILVGSGLGGATPGEGRLAYLSVCESATPDSLIPDEATHPAAVLHVGGPNVIATLRPVPDDSGLEVAAEVYAALVCDGVLDERQSARALHDALHALRRARPGSTAPWTTYMHIGP